jgi:hypothetical protein
MKIYTDEQVRQAMQDAMIPSIYQMDLWGHLTYIELPSDEEIEGACNEELNGLLSTFGFRKGAKWVIEQIKQQDNDRTI